MRLNAISLVMLLLFAALVPIGSAQKVAPIPANEGECGLESYSEMVQIAFEREEEKVEANVVENPSLEGEWLAVITGACGEGSKLAQYVSEQLGADSFKHSLHLDGAWIMTFSNDLYAKQSLEQNEYVEAFYPLINLDRDVRLIPNDPKFNDQWHLRNTGQSGTSGEDVNITSTWDNYKGTGVMISIVDDGVDTDHPDLSPNYNTALDYDYCGNDDNPNPSSNDHHGTSSAGVAAAKGNDATGVTGAAMDADLIGVLLLACELTDSREANALSHSRDFVDISSNSWGPSEKTMLTSVVPVKEWLSHLPVVMVMEMMTIQITMAMQIHVSLSVSLLSVIMAHAHGIQKTVPIYWSLRLQMAVKMESLPLKTAVDTPIVSVGPLQQLL
jgi:hypothetical protein